MISFVKNFHNNLFKKEFFVTDKRTYIVGLIVFYATLFSTFITIIGQIPSFSAAGITKYFQIGWVFVVLLLILLDYKQFTRAFISCLIILLPFLIYVLIELGFGIKSVSYQGTTYIFLCLIMFLQGMVLGKYFNFNFLKSFAVSYVLAAIIYAVFVFIERLRGHVGDTAIYAFDDKNSAGPIFMIAALLPFIIFRTNKPFSVILKVGIFCGFMLICLLAKARATIVFAPFAVILLHLFLPKTKLMKIISVSGLCILMAIGLTILFTNEYLYQRIVVHFIFNDKKTFEDLFSGRIQQIETVFNLFRNDTNILLFGTGSYYIDCMPISLVATYGIFGVILMIPIFALPIYSIIKSKKYLNHKGTFFTINLIILLSLYFNCLFEGLGFIGTGTKVFALWILVGYSYQFVVEDKSVKHACDVVDRPASFCSKIKAKPFSIIFQLIFIISSGILLISKNTVFLGGEKLFNMLPLSQKTAPITLADTEDIDRSIMGKLGGCMCDEQQIKFKTISNTPDGIDSPYQFVNGWFNPGALQMISPNEGIVKAVNKEGKTVGTILCCHFRTTENSKYIQFDVVSRENYDFTNKVCIDIEPINYSFETLDRYSTNVNSNITITLKKDTTAKLYYDSFVYPFKDNESFKFESDNPSIASVNENGIVTANSAGTCVIKGKGDKGLNPFYSKNQISIEVVEDPTIKKVERIGFKESVDKFYQYQPYKLSDIVIFNNEASDKTFDIALTDLNDSDYSYNEKTTEIIFKKPIETFNLKITSRSNPELSCISKFSVEENSPTKITCDNSWIVVGQKYDVKSLGLKLHFKNGYWKYLEDSDLTYDVHQFVTKRRVTKTSTGFCDGILTSIQGVKSGSFKYTYVCKINPQITKTISFRSSIYTYPQYVNYCINLGLILAFIVLAICSLFLFGIRIKSKFLYLLLSALFIGYITLIVMFIYELNQYTIGCLIGLLLLVFLISLIRLTALKNKALNLFPEKEDD